jgi:hypothetical protein
MDNQRFEPASGPLGADRRIVLSQQGYETVTKSQRALLRAARTCSKEARRAELLGRRRYAREFRGSALRAWSQAAVEGPDLLVKAIACVKNACDLADGLPGRDSDADAHDKCVKAMHDETRSARSSLEQHLNPNYPPPKSGQRRYAGSRSSVSGHESLLRALDCLHKADDEADRLGGLLGEGDETERDNSASNLHAHCKAADESFQEYHDVVIADPEAEKRRSVARAWAKTVAVGLH